MLLDSLNGVIPPQAMEVKLEKKKEPVDTKPIEQSGTSRHPQLELQEENIAEEAKIKQVIKKERKFPELYNAKGNLVQKSTGQAQQQKIDALHLTV